jgi:hypothetical protein
MPDLPQTKFDQVLERASKTAGVLLPLIIAAVGGFYTYQKDQNDKKTQEMQAAQDLSQKQYSNLTALLPMLLSKDPAAVSAALNVYTEETQVGQAPLSLKGVIENIGSTQPVHRAEAQAAAQGAALQSTGKCKSVLGGLFIQVANNPDQLKNGRALATLLKSASGLPAVQDVQRVDEMPQQTQLRYYFDSGNNMQADSILQSLQQHGFQNVQRVDLSQSYLKVGCPPPPTFELWVGSLTPLSADGSVASQPSRP